MIKSAVRATVMRIVVSFERALNPRLRKWGRRRVILDLMGTHFPNNLPLQTLAAGRVESQWEYTEAVIAMAVNKPSGPMQKTAEA